jgi:hypothetical protein
MSITIKGSCELSEYSKNDLTVLGISIADSCP